MFHMTWNGEIRGTSAIMEQLGSRLPPGWRADVTKVRGSGRRRSAGDLRLTIVAPDGSRSVTAVKVLDRIEPRDVEPAVRALRATGEDAAMLLAPYLSPGTRARIVEAGASYADASGNLRLALGQPAVFVETQGADRDPNPEPRALASLKGPASARVVRAVCDFRPPYGVRDLAARTDTAPASVSRVLGLLDREGLVERTRRGQVLDANWAKILRRWAEDYDLVASNRTSTWLAPRGLDRVLGRLARQRPRYAVTGSFAAARLAPVAAPRLLTLFVDDAAEAARRLDLRPAEAGANVLLAEPGDPVVFDRTIDRDGLRLAGPSQIAADLLTSPGRGPAEAEALLGWMKDHEDAWRR